MEPWDHHLALGQARATADLEVLAPRTTLAVADSGYNETHLAEAGFVATAVIAPSATLGGEARAVVSSSTHDVGRAGPPPGSRSGESRPTNRSSMPSPPWP